MSQVNLIALSLGLAFTLLLGASCSDKEDLVAEEEARQKEETARELEWIKKRSVMPNDGLDWSTAASSEREEWCQLVVNELVAEIPSLSKMSTPFRFERAIGDFYYPKGTRDRTLMEAAVWYFGEQHRTVVERAVIAASKKSSAFPRP